jgi:hypothetical protein
LYQILFFFLHSEFSSKSDFEEHLKTHRRDAQPTTIVDPPIIAKPIRSPIAPLKFISPYILAGNEGLPEYIG